MFEKMAPETLARWLIVAALVYLVLPYDFIPDFFGLPGRIDDVAFMGWLFWFYRNHLAAERPTGPESSRSPRAQSAPNLDAYAILGVSRGATPEAIQSAYRARMQEYHPDKVAHLGEALQKVATEKTQEIQRAYQELRR